jgi:arginine decarboxylase
MWSVPKYFWVTSGDAEGGELLNAFDNALLAAGIGNLNLIRVSSVMPAGITEAFGRPPHLLEGSLTPCVYSVAESDVPGETIASCVGIARTKDSYGVIFEHAGAFTAAHAERVVRKMVHEAFEKRGLEIDSINIRSAEHTVEQIGCTVAAVMLW